MNELEYLNDSESGKESISEFLEPSSPSGSCWWSNLKNNLHGFKSLSDFVISRHKKQLARDPFDGKGAHESSTAKTCPAILDILKNSFLIKMPCDFVITVDRNEEYIYDSASNWVTIDNHSASQFHVEKNNIFEGKMDLKIQLPVVVRTDGVPMLFMQPMYHNNKPYTVVNGAVTGKHTSSLPLNINILIDIPKTDEPVSYKFNYGDVIAYLWTPEKLKLSKSKDSFYKNISRKRWSSKSIHD